ncbi:MbcA/ParS/Xre antitoxin family protein [Tolumonas lignilytica]|uniref:MbcA/ParS/Xre antitoxin family protein n=1 Tax=Tolumonas lignilytica TaxID=1283284 RepID=UPI000467AB3B|nr:MbcA/ParS/Xre antitoxin family protein [Tolumonas lignilytica]
MKSAHMRNYSKALQAATEYFEGDMETAELWMKEPAKSLGGKCPTDLVSTEEGLHTVLDVIQRLEDGSFQ